MSQQEKSEPNEGAAKAPGADRIWKDRKRTFLGLPWSFTRYSLYPRKLVLKKGFFTITEDEILLYRILDLRLIRTLGQRIFGLGTIVVISGDATSPEFKILSVKKSGMVKDRISELVDAERTRLNLKGRELYGIADETEAVADAAGDHI
jgi:uncharacterized membrane protein YdbT with pleckstrin-like domain